MSRGASTLEGAMVSAAIAACRVPRVICYNNPITCYQIQKMFNFKEAIKIFRLFPGFVATYQIYLLLLYGFKLL